MVKISNYQDIDLDHAQYIDYYLSYDQLDKLISDMLLLLDNVTEIHVSSGKSFSKILSVIRVGYLREKSESLLDGNLVQAGAIIHLLGAIAINESSQVEIYNENYIPHTKF